MLGKVGKDLRNIEIIGHGHLTRSNLQQLTVWFVTGLSSSDEGASHGGEGGRITSSTAQAYDNFLTPTEPGSGSSKARGGGVLHLSTQSLVLRGTISAK